LFLCTAAAGVYFWPKSTALPVPQVSVLPKASPETGVNQSKEMQVTTEAVVSPNLNPTASIEINTAPATIDTAVSKPESLATVLPLAVPAGASLANENLVTFKASGETWVEVKSATGNSLFKKLLNAGESAGTSGTLPLTVIVGRADVTKVEVRGKPFDLTPIAKSNVARFEVN
jgi:cytoskeleton protein RodZ